MECMDNRRGRAGGCRCLYSADFNEYQKEKHKVTYVFRGELKMKRKIIFTAAIILLCAGLFGLYMGLQRGTQKGTASGNNESGYFKNTAAPKTGDVQKSDPSSSTAVNDKQVSKSGKSSGSSGEKTPTAAPTPRTPEKLPDNFKVIDTVTNKVLLSSRVDFENTNAGDATLKALQDTKVEYKASRMGGAMYVSMIGGIAEMSAGPSSGWCYYVNGAKPGCSASSYALKKDDVLEWKFQKDGLNN